MGWFTSDNNEKENSSFIAWVNGYVTFNPKAYSAFEEIQNFSPSQTAFIALACSGSFFLGWRFAKGSSSWTRIISVSDISSAKIGADSPLLRGRVVSVSDGDTFRLLHVPTRVWHSSRLAEGEKLSTTTLPIRICTIDTPETAKFGKSGQPFGEEAKEHLKSLMLDRMINIRLLEKDQYGRGVAEVQAPGPFFGWPTKYMDQEMLRAGLAEVYQGSGAVYGHKGKEAYIAMLEKAKKSKKGMWVQDNRESAAEYKARMKAEG
jgi:micrococcal nuclease